MGTRRPTRSRFAVCVNNSEYPASLELHRLYPVLRDKDAERDGDLRIVDESGEDYLYPAERFLVVNLPRRTARTLRKSLGRTLQRAV
ncbi:MAG: hypothetical protein FJ279_13950 [Planctomycetes bacterium]|nr:hypothetical protein [Planctomycetota bacterium]MBM4081014.1 hypothetical protein [Planctomycetota bacterium]MBM4085358.1 hypothetical protein [Planctomycetota bacterium]